jgi:short-subunit dehydrogenase
VYNPTARTAPRKESPVNNRPSFASRYPGWALVAGASEGLGAAFARELAGRGLTLVLVARRAGLLDALASELRRDRGVEVRALALDLASPDSIAAIASAVAGIEVSVLVCNAALAPMGDFLEAEPASLEAALDLNARAPLRLARALLPPMVARGRGALVIMSSLAGFQGSPRLATYAATKAFGRVLAESLWGELRERGVDVQACCAGAIRTPGYLASATKDAPGTLDPDYVARHSLDALGSGPVFFPGATNRIGAFVMGKLLPKRVAIALMAGNTAGLGAKA